MSNTNAWEKQEGESLLWHRRFERFKSMPVRSIAAVFREEMGDNERKEPPGRWYEESKQWRWEERAAAWDAFQDEQVEKQIIAERKKVLRSRYALMHKRVEALDAKAAQLYALSESEGNLWNTTDRGGMTFNGELFRELRGAYADIAAELGERVKRTETTVKSMPKLYIDLDPDEDGSVE